MKLLGSLTSPYVRKTRVVLAEKKIDYEFVLDSPWVEGNSVSQYNPLGKIPVLIFDDHSTLFDSRVIVEYLDNLAPNNRLIPAPGRERTQVKRWEALADGICDAASAAFLESRRNGAQQSQEWIDRQHSKIELGLATCANDLSEQPWCFGNTITLADIALGSTLGYLVFRLSDIPWQEQYPNLARLYGKLMLRQSFIDTVPQG
jgi:glutathione S-transferase